MTLHRTLTLLVLVTAAGFAFAQGPPSRHYAVVVGSLLPEDHLNFTINDAQLMAQLLRANGAEVRLILPGTTPPSNREPILDACREMAAKAGPNDVFWFYFSGHGDLGADGRSYLLPRDTRLMDPSTMIAASDLRKIVADRSKARLNLFVLDACHSGSLKSAPIDAVRPFDGLKGSVTIAACRPDETALEVPLLRHGLFTFFLVRGLAGAGVASDGKVSVTSLRDYVISQVEDYSRNNSLSHAKDPQTPVFEFSDSVQGQTVTTPLPEVLNSMPEPQGQAEPIRPFKPGVILSVVANSAAEVDQAVQLMQHRLLASSIPVLDARRAGEFENILSSGSIAAAAAQAGDLTATFLLRVRMEVNSTEMVLNGTRVCKCEIVLRGELVDSEGRILSSDTSDSLWGVPVAASAFSKGRAASAAVSKAIDTLAKQMLPAMERHLAVTKKGGEPENR